MRLWRQLRLRAFAYRMVRSAGWDRKRSLHLVCERALVPATRPLHELDADAYFGDAY
jgi:hypothetical protein